MHNSRATGAGAHSPAPTTCVALACHVVFGRRLPIHPVEILVARLLGGIKPVSDCQTRKGLGHGGCRWERVRVLLRGHCPGEVAGAGVGLVAAMVGHGRTVTVVHRTDENLAAAILREHGLLGSRAIWVL